MKSVSGQGIMVSVVAVLIIVAALFGVQSFSEDDEPSVSNTQLNTSPEIPDSLFFAGEWVPLEYFDVRENLEKELLINTYWHSQTLLLLKKSKRYFNSIDPILMAYNIPLDFRYMPVVESGLDNVVSPSNARGYWQLLSGTAIDYGLTVTSEVDERYLLEKSTEAACNYLLDSYKKYSNWTLAAASFNSGRRGVDRQLVKQREENFYDVLYNDETTRYIYRILAFKCIFENPERYGFYLTSEDYYYPIPTDTIIVDESISDLSSFAQKQHSNYKILKLFNPWLRSNRLSISKGQTYQILVPKKDFRRNDKIYNLAMENDSIPIY